MKEKTTLGLPEASRNNPGLNLFGAGFFATLFFLKSQKEAAMTELS